MEQLAGGDPHYVFRVASASLRLAGTVATLQVETAARELAAVLSTRARRSGYELKTEREKFVIALLMESGSSPCTFRR